MMRSTRRWLWILASLCASGSCLGAAPYADPTLLDLPWGNYSFLRQGWRGYVETLPAARYLDGLGIVWGRSPPGRSADAIATELAWAGFRRVRLEIPWGSVKWDESGFDDASTLRLTEILTALKRHELRPLILLNANHLQPCPVQWASLRVEHPAAAGERGVRVSGELPLLPGSPATLMSLADGTRPGPLILSVSGVDASAGFHSPRPRTLALSKPLPRALAVGEDLRVAILRYPPLGPVGSPEFDRTAAGWLRYVTLVARLVERTYGDSFDVEIWNELTFGSGFLDVANYFQPEPDREPGSGATHLPDFLHPGGSAWELARRTTGLLKERLPDVQVIWGFSNTTFFNVRIAELPARLDGQSYHPYGTGRRCYADLVRGKEKLLLDGYVPDGCVVQPEGYAHAWQQTESLLRFIAPGVRAAHPPESRSFRHYITEHGLSPAEIGINDRAGAEHAKRGFALRAPLLWLNKGLAAIYLFDLYEPDDSGFGLYRADGSPGAGMRALHRMTREFAAGEPAAAISPLGFELAREGPPKGVLPGDPDGLHLRQEEAVALLPFQRGATDYVIGAYVMTQDFPRPLAPQPYRVRITGLDGRHVTVKYFSPEMDKILPIAIVARSSRSLTIRLSFTEIPSLIEISGAAAPGIGGES